MTTDTPLANAIAARGLKQSRIAWLLEVDPAVVSMWVSGKRPIPESRLRPLADVLECTVDELLGTEPGSEEQLTAAIRDVLRFGVPDEQRGSDGPTQSAAPSGPPPHPETESSEPAIPRYKWPLQIGCDGTLLGPSQPRIYCTCGRRVR